MRIRSLDFQPLEATIERGRELREAVDAARLEATRLTHALTVAEERTRSRIAAGLHDDIGQLLTMIRLRLRALADAPPDAPIPPMVRGIEALLDEASRLVRSVTFELTSPVLQQLGLAAAIESLGPRIEADGGPCFHFVDEGIVSLDRDSDGVLFRIVRELLLNVRKHARATNVWVTLRATTDAMTISVRDDGIGFRLDPDGAACTPFGGYGLYSSVAQVHGMGGSLQVHSPRSGGATVELRVPRQVVPEATAHASEQLWLY